MYLLNNLPVLIVVVAGLTGCATAPGRVTKMYPPVELLQDCSISPYGTATNADLSNAILILKKDIQVCNNDKAALRQWSDDSKPIATEVPLGN